MDRSLQGLRRSHVALALTLLVAASLLIDHLVVSPSSPPASITPASQFQSTWWIKNLGVDHPLSTSELADLNNLANSDLAPSDARTTAQLATTVALAQLEGQGAKQFTSYLSSLSAPLCKGVAVAAAAPVVLPVLVQGAVDRSNYAKVAVVYTGSCPNAAASQYQVLYLYLSRTSGSWQPVHELSIPGAYAIDPGASPVPPSWQMTHFTGCGSTSNTSFQDLIEVVDAFELLCQDAAQHGVALRLASAFRTPAEQAALFAQAVATYGSAAAAAKWVAPATATSCASRHCAGAALDLVDGDTAALAFVHQTVGCIEAGNIVLGPSSCTISETPISRLERYGFAAPLSSVPSYLEFVLPTSGPDANNQCNPSAALSMPQIVASVFRCRLQAAGIPSDQVSTAVASALVVSRCESGWNPAALAYGGRWATTPYPLTGQTYSNAGLFMLSASEASRYVYGGPAALTDPVANANGAASLWLATRSWQSFGCATGHGSFDSGPVLPQYGGPPLPAWTAGF